MAASPKQAPRTKCDTTRDHLKELAHHEDELARANEALCAQINSLRQELPQEQPPGPEAELERLEELSRDTEFVALVSAIQHYLRKCSKKAGRWSLWRLRSLGNLGLSVGLNEVLAHASAEYLSARLRGYPQFKRQRPFLESLGELLRIQHRIEPGNADLVEDEPSPFEQEFEEFAGPDGILVLAFKQAARRAGFACVEEHYSAALGHEPINKQDIYDRIEALAKDPLGEWRALQASAPKHNKTGPDAEPRRAALREMVKRFGKGWEKDESLEAVAHFLDDQGTKTPRTDDDGRRVQYASWVHSCPN